MENKGNPTNLRKIDAISTSLILSNVGIIKLRIGEAVVVMFPLEYRYKAMTEPMLNRLKVLMEELCQKWQCEYTESNGEPDHFHLVFRYYPQLQLSKFIDNIKSVSSRRLNQEYNEYLREIYPPSIKAKTGKESRVFWNESYAINSVGGAKLDVLIKYVKTQPRELLEQVTRENQY